VDSTYRHSNWKRLIFSIKDTGKGISKENIDKLFKLFGNVKSTNKVNENGIGLGLAFCKNIVEKF
jgi:signal transduction histidine kinase